MYSAELVVIVLWLSTAAQRLVHRETRSKSALLHLGISGIPSCTGEIIYGRGDFIETFFQYIYASNKVYLTLSYFNIYILDKGPLFTESALRPIQSISCDVRLSVCLCVCLWVTP